MSERVLRVGCPMWVNRDWVGRYFPVDTPKGHELVAYSRWCTAVEGNTTFYAQPSSAAVARWAEQAPADFRFVFKLPKVITHDRRLRDVGDLTSEFLRSIEPLGERIGPVTVQLPDTFAPSDLTRLRGFLQLASNEHRWAVEVRHRGFDHGTEGVDRLHDLLVDAGADRVLFYTRPLFERPAEGPEAAEAHARKPRVMVRPVALGHHPIVRLIAPDAASALDAWQRWVPHVARWVADGRTPYVFTHTPDNLDAPRLARAFHETVAAEVDDLAPLPDTSETPGQAQLW